MMQYINLTLAIILILSCDESGSIDDGHLGKWNKMADTLVNSLETIVTTPDDWLFNSTTLNFLGDKTYIRENIYTDTTWRYSGIWNLSNSTMNLYEENGLEWIYDMDVEGTILLLTIRGNEGTQPYRKVNLYHRMD